MRIGDKQEIETLIGEEALLFARYLRNEAQAGKPRVASLASTKEVDTKKQIGV